MGAVGRNVFFEEALESVLEQTFNEFHKLTGRRYSRLTQHQLERAETVFIVEGAAVETAITVADSLPETGVIGVSCMRPFPAQQLRAALKDKPNIIVLERLLPAPGAETPLLREIRQSLTSPSSLLHSVSYGIGGAPLRVADLALLPSSVSRDKSTTLHLGIDFEAETTHPKRQVLLDQLKRAYPDIAEAGLRAKDDALDTDSEGTISIAVLRSGTTGHAHLAQDVANILHRVEQGTVRSRAGLSRGTWGGHEADFLIHSTKSVLWMPIHCIDFATAPGYLYPV
jgi:pyruvate-ferredoxin/flavodoxin oxidoreductase